MAKVLVVKNPNELVFAGMVAAAGASPERVASVRELIELKRQEMEVFAQFALGRSARGVARTMSAEATATPPYTILPALNAMIVDEDAIDRLTLESGMGARVFDNVRVSLVEPEPVTESAEANPDFWHHDKISVDMAREEKLDGEGVLAGVLDTGIDSLHSEFKGKNVHFAEFDENGNLVSETSRDAGSHGTHVCGLIAGSGAGVAPKADLAVAAILTIPTPSGLSGTLVQIAAGLDWLLTGDFRGEENDPGVDILNASLGSGGYTDYLYNTLLTARMTQGVLMTAAIGNNGRSGVDHHISPGNYDIVLAVGATDGADRVADFSDWGTVSQHRGITKPDLCAPGDGVWSSVPGGGYQAMSGTSMASPIVCGAAALLLQRNPSWLLAPDQLQNALLRLTRPADPPTRDGKGRLDLRDLATVV